MSAHCRVWSPMDMLIASSCRSLVAGLWLASRASCRPLTSRRCPAACVAGINVLTDGLTGTVPWQVLAASGRAAAALLRGGQPLTAVDPGAWPRPLELGLGLRRAVPTTAFVPPRCREPAGPHHIWYEILLAGPLPYATRDPDADPSDHPSASLGLVPDRLDPPSPGFYFDANEEPPRSAVACPRQCWLPSAVRRTHATFGPLRSLCS